MATWAAYESKSSASLAMLTRGPCAPGERQVASMRTGGLACVPLHAFPNALNIEAQDLARSGPPHMRACGTWLRGGVALQPSLRQRPDYMSMHGDAEATAAVRRIEAAMHDSARVTATNVGKFQFACRRVVTAGGAAVRRAAKRAYAHLLEEADVARVATAADAARALGTLAGHYCEAPVALAWGRTGAATGAAYRVELLRSEHFDAYVLGEALFLLDAASATQFAAEAANYALKFLATTEDTTLGAALLPHFVGGALGAHGAVAPSDAARIHTPPIVEFTAIAELSAREPQQVVAYLHGVAAACALTTRLLLPGADERSTSGAHAHWLTRLRAARPRLHALGQIVKPPPGHDPLFPVSAITARNATAARVSQLVGRPHSDVDAACLTFTRALFPDDIARMHHQIVVTPRLYARMEAAVRDVRRGVVEVLATDSRVRNVLGNPDRVAQLVNATTIRIPGAPRHTWAGSNVAAPTAQFSYNDGVLVMAAKQSRAHFINRFRDLALRSVNTCDRPPLYDPLTVNAYVWPDLGCAYYLLGMATPPWADEQYDNASLYARFGYIIGHELAHVSLSGQAQPTYRSAGALGQLLRYYPHRASTRDEAFADVLGTLGVLRTGRLDHTALCAHVSQLWCARVPPSMLTIDIGGARSGPSHPPANGRGDSLCATLGGLG